MQTADYQCGNNAKVEGWNYKPEKYFSEKSAEKVLTTVKNTV